MDACPQSIQSIQMFDLLKLCSTRTERVRLRRKMATKEYQKPDRHSPIRHVFLPRPEEPIVDLEGKHVLVIGSGIDLNERKLKDDIDGDKWDYIIRVNRFYGNPEDVGTRTDLYFVRGIREYSEVFPKNKDIPIYVVTRYLKHIYLRDIIREVQARALSTGLKACHWASMKGAASVSIIGFGYKDGEWNNKKIYPDGEVDTNYSLYWDSENRYVETHFTLID